MILNQPAREGGEKKKKEDQNCGCKVFISVWAFATSDLCAIKNVFSGNTFPRPPLFSPVSLCSAFISLNAISASLCQLTLFHWRGVCFTVSIPLCSLCLSFHFVSRSLLWFPLKQRRRKKFWQGTETGERLLIFWHTLPLLNQNQLRRNQVITSAAFLPSPTLPSCQIWSRFMKFFSLKWNRGQPVSQKERCKLDLMEGGGGHCINKNKTNSWVWDGHLTGFARCVWLCVFAANLPASQSSFRIYITCPPPPHVQPHPVGFCRVPGLVCCGQILVLFTPRLPSPKERNQHWPKYFSVYERVGCA